MKWIFFTAAICSVIPLSAWIRQNRTRGVKIWIVMGVLLYVVDPLHLYMAMVSWAYWPGFVKGFEITYIDLLSVAIYLSLPQNKNPVPFRLFAGAYLASVSISAFQANVPEASLFYVWQLIRMFFVFAVIAKACADDELVAPALLKGMGIGICLELCVAVWQRFVLGELQAGGTFGHQNSLGMTIHFVVFPLFALFLAGKRGWEPVIIPIVGVCIAMLTASRATLGLGALGYAATFAMSTLRKWTFRKGVFAIAGLVLLAFLVPLAISTLDSRFSVNPLSDEYDERAAFESAATSILSDHPMGIGANNYVVVANTMGYNQRAGVAPTMGSLSAHVHNAYLLVASETGYVGLVTYVLLLLQPLMVAFVWGRRAREPLVGDLLLGLGISLLIVYVHSFFEWVVVTYHLQYFVAVQSGMIAGLAQQVGYHRKTKMGIPRLASEGLTRNV